MDGASICGISCIGRARAWAWIKFIPAQAGWRIQKDRCSETASRDQQSPRLMNCCDLQQDYASRGGKLFPRSPFGLLPKAEHAWESGGRQ